MENNDKSVLRLAAKILATTAVISLVILLIGLLLRWDKPVQFSNGFFNTGALLVILGLLSIGGGFLQRSNFGIMYAESAGQANLAERTQRMTADIAQRYGSFLLLLVTGLLLIGIAAAVNVFW